MMSVVVGVFVVGFFFGMLLVVIEVLEINVMGLMLE